MAGPKYDHDAATDLALEHADLDTPLGNLARAFLFGGNASALKRIAALEGVLEPHQAFRDIVAAYDSSLLDLAPSSYKWVGWCKNCKARKPMLFPDPKREDGAHCEECNSPMTGNIIRDYPPGHMCHESDEWLRKNQK